MSDAAVYDLRSMHLNTSITETAWRLRLPVSATRLESFHLTYLRIWMCIRPITEFEYNCHAAVSPSNYRQQQNGPWAYCRRCPLQMLLVVSTILVLVQS